jgi:hypothetical protein
MFCPSTICDFLNQVESEDLVMETEKRRNKELEEGELVSTKEMLERELSDLATSPLHAARQALQLQPASQR